DWSSDVCSSDLAVHPLQPLARPSVQGDRRLVRGARPAEIAVPGVQSRSEDRAPAANGQGNTVTRSRAVLLSALLALGAACEDSGDSRKARTPPPSSSTATVAGRCEHALPPALCTRCNPALAAVFQAKGDWCAEHGFPESFCPICHPNAPIPNLDAQPTGNEDSVIEARVVRFKSPEIEKTAGLATVKAERATA